jgi:hypothetical protein
MVWVINGHCVSKNCTLFVNFSIVDF